MSLEPEQLLHRLGPYIPTDRFRALLKGRELPATSYGAAMIVDISGFTPLTVSLVKQYGAQRASEELKRKLNPMFEAIGGLVFTHGGSVIRFVGDGFTAWFPDELDHMKACLPGLLRAAVAAIDMLETMVFFKELDLKIAVASGMARRWAVGDPKYGLLDVLAGPAVEEVSQIINRCQPHEARAHSRDAAILGQYPHLHFATLDEGDLLLKKMGAKLEEESRAHRWAAWAVAGDIQDVLEAVSPYVDPVIQEQEQAGLGVLNGELRYATPAFLQFAGLDYEHDPDARKKLNQYVCDVQSILDDTSGRLVSLEVADKGSVLFAVFGAPIAYGDDSRRAIHATLTFRDLPRIHPDILTQKIGVSRGLLYSGTVGGEVRREYTSLGDETNVASRLMSADKQGQILISQAVYDDCSEWFDFETGETISPKGRVGFIQTYTPLRVNQRIKRNLRRSPLVGRDAEWETVQQALNAVGLGRPQVLRVEGVAGIGKSRLAAELIHQSNEEKRLVGVGYSTSTSRSTAFLPWRGILRAFLEIDEDWNQNNVILHLEGWIAQRNPDWLPRLPLLCELFGLPFEDTSTTRNLTGKARQQALFSLVLEILYDLARQSPLTLVIEDTHWLDEVSEALTLELISRLTGETASILLVLLHRPALETQFTQHLFQTLENSLFYQHIHLDELDQAATQQLIEHQANGMIPDELRDFVFGKTQGNPFFILEIVDALIQSNTIKRIGPRIYLENDLNTLNLPQTVQGLILAKLDNLPETEKMILKLAAVIGKQFEIRVLYQSLPFKFAPEATMQAIRNLEKRQFISLESLYPEPLYSFRHAITQEVTYQTLLYDQRQQWHRIVGMVLETLHPNRWDQLAYHFSQSADHERAYIYQVRAGDQAAREFANQAALDHWGAAIQLSRSRKDTFDLLSKRIEILMRTGDLPQTQANLDELSSLATTQPHNLNWQIRLRRYWSEHAINQGYWERARTFAEQAVSYMEQYQDLQLLWELYSIQTRIYSHLGAAEAKQATTYKLRQVAIELNDPIKTVRLALNDLLELAATDPQSALQSLESLYHEVSRLGDPMLEANYWNVVSQIGLQNAYYVLAERALKTQLHQWRQVGNRRMEANSLLNLGIALAQLGQYSAAGANLRESYNLSIQVADEWSEAQSLVYLGVLALRRQAYGEASAYIDRGLYYFESIKAFLAAGRALYWLGLIEVEQDQVEAARGYLRRAVEAFSQVDHFQSLPQIQLALAFSSAKGLTLPFVEDVQDAFSALTEGKFQQFLAPDVAFWHALTVSEIFGLDTLNLQMAFMEYLQVLQKDLTEEPKRQTLFKLGYIPQVMQKMGLKQL